MRSSVPRAHVVDRRRLWRLVALVLALMCALSLLEIANRPDAWDSIVVSMLFPAFGAPIAWSIGPRLSPVASFRCGRVFLLLAVVTASDAIYIWRGTQIAGAMAFHLVLAMMFAALFFRRRDIIQLLIASAIGVAIALTADGVTADDALLWLLTLVTIAAVGFVLQTSRDNADALAYRDGLTGASNRREWDLVLDDVASRHRRSGDDVALLLIDIDHFKQINDEFGHEHGDDVLRTAVAVWRRHLRPDDTLARLGGDEFGILLPGCDASEAQSIAERLRDILADRTQVTCSIGIATAGPGDDVRLLRAAADQQLYRSKADGRARVSVATAA